MLLPAFARLWPFDGLDLLCSFAVKKTVLRNKNARGNAEDHATRLS